MKKLACKCKWSLLDFRLWKKKRSKGCNFFRFLDGDGESNSKKKNMFLRLRMQANFSKTLFKNMAMIKKKKVACSRQRVE